MERIRGQNITAKILCLILAVVLWIYVTNEQNPLNETTLTVPLEVRSVASPLVAVDAPDSVRVKVRGTRGSIAGLQQQDIKSYIDLRGLGEGRQTAKVYVQLPTGLELLEVSPERVTVKLDTAVSRKLPVEIRITGTAQAGVAIGKAAVLPEQVTVEGAKSMVDTVDKVVVPLDITNKNTDFSVSVTPVALNKEGKEVEGVTITPDRVDIAATLARGVSKKFVDIKTIVYGDLPQGVVLRGIITNPARVEISGDPQTLDKVDFVYTEPINLAGIDKDTTKEVKLQFKEGVVAAQGTVKVQISVSH